MNTPIKTFSSQFGDIRIVEHNNEPYFVGSDVAKALGYVNAKDALIKHVDDDDKQILKGSDLRPLENHIPKTVLPMNFVDANIPNRGLTIINESGLYSLIMSSKLPTAKQFKHWVTSDVLPTIRKHGAYMTENFIERTLNDPDYLIKVATTLKEERTKRLLAEQDAQRKQLIIEQQQPKCVFADAVTGGKGDILVREFAKILSNKFKTIGQNRLFQWFVDHHYLMTRNNYEPYQQYVDQGLFTRTEHPVDCNGTLKNKFTTKITPKGQAYFIQKYAEEQPNDNQLTINYAND